MTLTLLCIYSTCICYFETVKNAMLHGLCFSLEHKGNNGTNVSRTQSWYQVLVATANPTINGNVHKCTYICTHTSSTSFFTSFTLFNNKLEPEEEEEL